MHPYYGDRRSDDSEQFRAIGWVAGRLYSLIYENVKMKKANTIIR